MTNKEISARFELLAELMELSGENSFKSKTYSIAAFRIGKEEKNVLDMNESELKKIPNFGPAVISKIEELRTLGVIPALEQLIAATPPGLIEMLQVKGLGASKVRKLWLELEIESLGELLYACQENRLASLKGFGKKTQEKIQKNIEFILANRGQYLYQNIEKYIVDLHQKLQPIFAPKRIELTGDFAKQNNTISVIEWITNVDISDFKNKMELLDFEILEESEASLTIKTDLISKIVFHFATSENFENQFFELNTDNDFSEKLKNKLHIDNISEQKFEDNKYALPFIIPAKRNILNFELYESGKIDNISVADIKGLIHCHSRYSDGIATLQEMAKACMDRGLEYMVITDHSQAAFYANGLSRERIFEQHSEIENLNKKCAPFKIFKGIEADILYNGDLDYDDEVWKSMDVIIASVHSNLQMDQRKATERIMSVLDNPYVKILGHPTARLLLSREGYPIDHKQIIDKCVARNIVIELNANPRRLDIDWSWINYIIESGGLLSINPDAHSVEGIDHIKYGVISAQKSMLAPKVNLSSFSLDLFTEWMNKN